MKTDVLIVGSGLAGLIAGLGVDSSLDVLMICNDKKEKSDSSLAQGGISTLLHKFDYESYLQDTLKAGRFENDIEVVKTMIDNSNDLILDLIKYGVEFDFDYTREGGHSAKRILHHQDVTGKEITTKLLIELEQRKNITLFEQTAMLDLIIVDNVCLGAIILKDGIITPVYAGQVILATGGIGGLFKQSTNYTHIKGDSFAIAIKNNIELDHLDYIQIHPTLLYSKDKGRNFLISESIRGEGAVIVDKDGNQFVDSLLPRDIVAKAIKDKMVEQNTDHVYLDVSNIPYEKMIEHFPNIYQTCLERGIDPYKDRIPIMPGQHYLMGGIKASVKGQTSIRNLYAIGETAGTGVHGKNRLASNSLLESGVFAKLCAKHINENKQDPREIGVDLSPYENISEYQEANRKTVLDYLKNKNKEFYNEWLL